MQKTPRKEKPKGEVMTFEKVLLVRRMINQIIAEFAEIKKSQRER